MICSPKKVPSPRFFSICPAISFYFETAAAKAAPPPLTCHVCRGLILKDLWAEIFFAAPTLIVKTEQVTIRTWKRRRDGEEDIKHRATAATVSK